MHTHFKYFPIYTDDLLSFLRYRIPERTRVII
jgi:hypothetical protein